jgi:hypothetical protein
MERAVPHHCDLLNFTWPKDESSFWKDAWSEGEPLEPRLPILINHRTRQDASSFRGRAHRHAGLPPPALTYTREMHRWISDRLSLLCNARIREPAASILSAPGLPRIVVRLLKMFNHQAKERSPADSPRAAGPRRRTQNTSAAHGPVDALHAWNRQGLCLYFFFR